MKKTNNTARALRHLVLALSAIAFAVPAVTASAASFWGSDKVQGSGNFKTESRASWATSPACRWAFRAASTCASGTAKASPSKPTTT
jgi:hypothetical protein